MEFRDCFINKPSYLDWGLSQTIVDKTIVRINKATPEESRNVDFNLAMWKHYIIKDIFTKENT